MPTRKAQTYEHAVNLIAGECLAVRMRMINRTITAIYDEALRPLGLTAGQLNILVVIAKRDPISPGDIARRLNMDKSTVSRNIQRMRMNGWLNVAAAASGRGQLLTLTREGKTMLPRSVPAWTQAQTQARAVLGRRGAESIHRLGNAVWSHRGRN